MDSGSQSSFITSELRNPLNLECLKINIPIVCKNNSSTQVSSKVVGQIKSIDSNYSLTITFLVLGTIIGIVPQFKTDVSPIPIPQNLAVDPEFLNLLR